MRTMIYAMQVSLDGFIEGPLGDLDWTGPGEDLHRHFNELDERTELHCYGRGLYETMAAFWPKAEGMEGLRPFERDYARIWMTMRKVVFSRKLKSVDWNSELVSDHVAERVKALKAEGDGLMSVGGAGLAASFMRLGLIDEYRLYVYPVMLGGGKPMFPTLEDRLPLRLVETRTFNSGVVMLRYETPGSGPKSGPA